MEKRFGSYVFNSDTAYCFGGDGVTNLHKTKRSKRYFLHNTESNEIIPISEKKALSFAKMNDFPLIRKRNVHVQAILSYDIYHKLFKICNEDKEQVKDFVKSAIIEKLNKRSPS